MPRCATVVDCPSNRCLRQVRVGAAFALFALGCGGRSVEPVPLEAFHAEAHAAVCAWAVRCLHVPDHAICERMIDPKEYDVRRAQDAVASGRLDYDPKAAGACLRATAEAHCLVEPLSDGSCDRMFRGLLAEGEACTSDFECRGGAACEDAVCEGQCCRGTCGAPAPDPDEPELAEVGEPCRIHFDCVPSAYCETDGVCTEVPDREGARCLFGCARGDLFCDLDTLVCTAYAGEGEPCDPEGAGDPPCDPAWSFCDGVCRPLPGAGEPCDEEARRCVPSAFCDPDGVCRERGGPGDPCRAHDECSVACVEERCVEYESCDV